MDNNFIVQLIARLDSSKTITDLDRLEQELNKRGIDLKATLNTATTKKEINELAKNLKDALASVDFKISTRSLYSAMQEIRTATERSAKKQYNDLLSTAKELNSLKIEQKKLNPNVNLKEWEELSSKISKVQAKYDSLLNDFWSNSQNFRFFTTEDLQRLDEAGFAFDRFDAKLSDTASIQKSKQVYDDLVSTIRELNKLELSQAKLDPNLNSEEFAEMSQQIDIVQKKYEKLLNEFWSSDVNKNIFSIEDLQLLDEEFTKASKSVELLKAKIRDLNNVKSDKIKIGLDTGSYALQVDTITSKFQKWGLSEEDVKSKTKELTKALAKMNAATNAEERIAAEKEYKLALEKTNNELKSLLLNSASRSERSNLSNKIKSWLEKNTKASKNAKKELLGYIATLDSVDDIGVPALKNIKNKFDELEIKERNAGRLGKSFADTFKQGVAKFTEWGIASNSVMAVWNKAKDAVQAVYDIDTAMTNLYKVTDETAERYDRFIDSACDGAKELGRSVSSLIEQTATWSKLGYSLDDSEKLAKVSSIYANVAEVDDETAVSDLVTAMKAYKLQTEDAIKIADKLNALGNKFATSAADLGTGLSNSASALSLAGNSIDETLAMITAMTEITQDASESGNALKILSMRIRGMKGELEALGEESEGIESISKIQTQILNLTSGKVNIFDDAGNFKSTYKIMEEISGVWTEMSQVDQAQLLEIIAGKQRGNSISALLTNMAQANEALNASINSSGSAYEEQERWMESLEAKTARFEAAFQSLSATILDSDLLKFIVDFGTGAVTAIDKVIGSIGSLGTALTIGSGVLGSKGFGFVNYDTDSNKWINNISGLLSKTKDFNNISESTEKFTNRLIELSNSSNFAKVDVENLAKKIGVTNTEIIQAGKDFQDGSIGVNKFKDTTKAATTATNAFGGALKSIAANMVIMLAINLVIKGVSAAWDALNVTVTEQQDKVDELTSSYNSLQSEFDTLSKKQELTDAEKERLDYLKERLELDKKILDIETQELYKNKVGTHWTDNFDKESLKGKQNSEENAFKKDSFKNIKTIYSSTVQAYNNAVLNDNVLAQDTSVNTLNSIYNDLYKKQSAFLDNIQEAKSAMEYFSEGTDEYNAAKEQYDYWSASYEEVCKMVDEIAKINGTYDYNPENISKRLGYSISADELKEEFSEEELSYLALDAKFDKNATLEDLRALVDSLQQETDDNPVELQFSKTEMIKTINSMADGMSVLDEIYADIIDGGNFDFTNLDTDKFAKSFEGLEPAYEKFIETVSASPSDINACQNAFDELTQAFLEQKGVLTGLSEENANLAIDMLENMGIANAEEVVMSNMGLSFDNYAMAKRECALAGVDLINAEDAEIQALINKKLVTEETAQALFYYQLQKILANENGIETANDCANLIMLAENAGVTGEILEDLIELEQIQRQLESGQIISEHMVSKLMARAEELNASIKSQSANFKTTVKPITRYTGAAKSAAAANNKLKDATKDANDALKQQKEALEKTKEALEEQKNEYDELYDAIQWFYDKKLDGLDDEIEGLEKVNKLLEDQKDNLDDVLSAMKDVYQSEIDVLQDKMDALDKVNEKSEAELRLEEAKRKLLEAKSRKTKMIYQKGVGFTYQTDESAIKDAESELDEANAEKVKQGLQDQIDIYQSYIDRLEEIPDAYEKAMQKIAASKYLGSDWMTAILNPSDDLFNSLQFDYTGILSSISSNESKIESLEKQKEHIQELKDLWEDAKNAYRDAQYEAQLASFFGSDYEYQLLNNSASWRRKFADEYAEVCRQIEEIENQIKSLSEETTSSISSNAEEATEALKGTKSTLEEMQSVSKYLWSDEDDTALAYAKQRLDALNELIKQGRTELQGAAEKVQNFVNEYENLRDSRIVTDDLRNSAEELNQVYAITDDNLQQMASGVADRISDSKNFTEELIGNTQVASEAIQEVNEQIETLKTADDTINQETESAVSNVDTTISNLLTKLGEFKDVLNNLKLARSEIDNIATEEIIDTDEIVDNVHAKISEIQSSVEILIGAISTLHGSLDTLVEKLQTVDSFSMSNIISAFGGSAGGESGIGGEVGSADGSSGLLGAVNNVITAIGGSGEEVDGTGLLSKLSNVNTSSLEEIIGSFGLGDESSGNSLLDAVNAVSDAILGEDDDGTSLISRINTLGSDNTTGKVDNVTSSFDGLLSKITSCISKLEELASAIVNLPSSTASVGVSTHGGGGRGFAKGGIITKNAAGDFDYIAEAIGEDHTIAVQEGEAVIPKETVAANSDIIQSLLNAGSNSIRTSSPTIDGKVFERMKNLGVTPTADVKIPNYPQRLLQTQNINNSSNISIGDIHVHGVENVNSLSNEIINRLPNTLLQKLNKR